MYFNAKKEQDNLNTTKNASSANENLLQNDMIHHTDPYEGGRSAGTHTRVPGESSDEEPLSIDTSPTPSKAYTRKALRVTVLESVVGAGLLTASGLIIAEIVDNGLNSDYNYLGGDDYIVAALAAIAGIALLAHAVSCAKFLLTQRSSNASVVAARYGHPVALAAVGILGVYGVAVGLSTLLMPESGPLGTQTDHMEQMSHMGFTGSYDDADVATYFVVFGVLTAAVVASLGATAYAKHKNASTEKTISGQYNTGSPSPSSSSSSSSSSSPTYADMNDNNNNNNNNNNHSSSISNN